MTFRGLLSFAAVVYVSWLAMQAIHELGHVAAATLTGGTVARVVLGPLSISRTDVSPNPAPLIVAWGGPLVGVTIPVILAAAIRCRRQVDDHDPPSRSGLRSWVLDITDFFAGFCLITNGAYIGAGAFDRVGDAGELLRHGAPLWLLIAFGILATGSGLFLWHLALNRRRDR